jgi:hypothetical protein
MRDLSLRLKNGSAPDDATLEKIMPTIAELIIVSAPMPIAPAGPHQ